MMEPSALCLAHVARRVYSDDIRAPYTLQSLLTLSDVFLFCSDDLVSQTKHQERIIHMELIIDIYRPWCKRSNHASIKRP